MMDKEMDENKTAPVKSKWRRPATEYPTAPCTFLYGYEGEVSFNDLKGLICIYEPSKTKNMQNISIRNIPFLIRDSGCNVIIGNIEEECPSNFLAFAFGKGFEKTHAIIHPLVI